MLKVKVLGGDISKEEQAYYVNHIKESYPEIQNATLVIRVDGDYVDLEIPSVPFQRIRRITGYLVGTLDRFNNAKRSEVNDRVKHKL